jgi:hypothetical protein
MTTLLAILSQVAEELGDEVKVLKIDVDENPVLSSQLRVRGCGWAINHVISTSRQAYARGGTYRYV